MTHPEPAGRFPFSAIVAQEQMKQALLLNAANPAVGGVLIRGNKGTAKSTAVRSLTTLLPPIEVVAGCPYSCNPGTEIDQCIHCIADPDGEVVQRPVRIVDLPVSASEDRLVGSLDIERAIQSGQQAFEPGILAAAHRGILYIDEVNLLSDHLVDLLLDAAAMGRNYVERDGLSVTHPASFILVGTMNPEEGELRPQLLDRFGLMVEAESDFSRDDRIEVVRRRVGFEADPAGFAEAWEPRQQELRGRLAEAQALLPRVEVPDAIMEAVAAICEDHGVDGLRADITIYRAASTIAAWNQRQRVELDDVRDAARLALVHRQRRQPFQEPQLDQQRLDETLEQLGNTTRERDPHPPRAGDRTEPEDDPGNQPPPPEEGGQQPPTDEGATEDSDLGSEDAPDQAPAPIGASPPVRVPESRRRRDRRSRTAAGRSAATLTDTRAGRHVSSRPASEAPTDVDLVATLRTAAPKRLARARARTPSLEPSDLQEKVRETTTARLVVFVVDASGSMGARQRMEATKGAILSLLVDAYQQRDRVALITFRGDHADLVLPPTNSVERAHRELAHLATGGRTPLGSGLTRAHELIEAERRRDAGLATLLIVVTDGRANSGATTGSPRDAVHAAAGALALVADDALVIDTESGFVRLGEAQALADLLEGECVTLGEPTAQSLEASVRAMRSR